MKVKVLIAAIMIFAVPYSSSAAAPIGLCSRIINLLNIRNILSLRDYTIGGAEKINAALRSTEPPSQKLRQTIKRINRMLDSLADFKGQVFRWADMPPAEIEKYKPGLIFTEPAFLSTTTNENHGEGWYRSAHFEILSKHGKKVSQFSAFGFEEEILFKPGSQFKVVSVRYEAVVPNPKYLFEIPEKIAHIVLEEMDVEPKEYEPVFTKQNRPEFPLKLTQEFPGGSTGGRWWRDAKGTDWFLKKDQYRAEIQTAAEIISSRIYRALGYNVPDTALVYLNGIRYTASRKLEKLGTPSNLSGIKNPSVRALNFFAAYLKDWDRVQYNNFDLGNGDFALYDFAGTLGARSLGRPKGDRSSRYSDEIGTFEATEDLSVLYDSFKPNRLEADHPWNYLTAEDAAESIAGFNKLSDELIEEIVKSAQYTNLSDEKYMIFALRTRRDGFIKNILSRFRR